MADLDIAGLPATIATADFRAAEPILIKLDKYLTLRTYISGHQLSDDDKKVWTALQASKVTLGPVRKGTFANIKRWFTFVESFHPEVKEAATGGDKKKGEKGKANYNIGLKGTENGVVTRFPPEPSGYLHIGHAKAALLNDYFAHEAFDGKLILRFDDTNPSKEKQEFEDSIITDLALLNIKPDMVSHTSDYFGQLYEVCEQLVRDGKAYADDTDPTVQSTDRRDRLASKRRDRPAEESLAMLKEMKDGTDLGRKHCIRARIAFDSSNGALRDPVIYRFPNFADKEPAPHHRTGWTWNIYPTYDFACPVVDSIEGVTHALRTTEYADRNEQYHWFLEATKLRPVHLWDFARINFIRTFLSKRKLTKVVDTGKVTGWDDPRLPTVRGILRRGLTEPALREFMLSQGPSRNVVTMDWGKIWSINKRQLDPVIPRHVAVDEKDRVVCQVTGGPAAPYSEDKPKHPKNPSLGNRAIRFSSQVLLDQVDLAACSEGEEITLMNWGNAFVRKISKTGDVITAAELELHLAGDVKTTKQKLTWLAEEDAENKLTPAECWEFGDLITKDTLEKEDNLDDFLSPVTQKLTLALCDANLKDLKAGDFLQLERKGYFRVDKAAGEGPDGKAVLFKIPTGAAKEGTL